MYKGEEIKESLNESTDKSLNLKINKEKLPNKYTNLLKKLIPDADFDSVSYSKDKIKYIKFHFQYFFENRKNYLLQEKKRYYTAKQQDQHFNKDLVFTPMLSPTSLKAAEIYRKKCIEEIESEQKNLHLTKRKIKLEEVYIIHKKKKISNFNKNN